MQIFWISVTVAELFIIIIIYYYYLLLLFIIIIIIIIKWYDEMKWFVNSALSEFFSCSSVKLIIIVNRF